MNRMAVKANALNLVDASAYWGMLSNWKNSRENI
jgi:hypothetical protein